jgi:hypothetical protein
VLFAFELFQPGSVEEAKQRKRIRVESVRKRSRGSVEIYLAEKYLATKEFILVLVLLMGAPSVVLVNAPGRAYIQCDPQNRSSHVRCNADSW